MNILMDGRQYARHNGKTQWHSKVAAQFSCVVIVRDFLAISKTAMILLVNDSGNAYRFLDMLLKHIRALSKHLSDNKLIQNLLSSQSALNTEDCLCVYSFSLCL